MPVKQNNSSGQEGSASYHDNDNSVKVTKQNQTKNTHHTTSPTTKKTNKTPQTVHRHTAGHNNMNEKIGHLLH